MTAAIAVLVALLSSGSADDHPKHHGDDAAKSKTSETRDRRGEAERHHDEAKEHGRKAAPAPASGLIVEEPREVDQPPQGTPEDQALWRRGFASNRRTSVLRQSSTRLQLRTKQGQLYERLEARAKAAGGGDAAASKVLATLLSTHQANVALLTGEWPIDKTRSCQYELLYLEGFMPPPAGTTRAGQHQQVRAGLEECLRRADLIHGRMEQANQAFSAAIVEAETLLGPAPAAAGAKATPAGGAP